MSIFTPNASALITGAASGIGLALAHHCRKAGMRVTLVDRNVEALQKAKESVAYGQLDAVCTFDMDVSQHDAWTSLKKDVLAKLGTPDLLVLNAGVGGGAVWGDGDGFARVLGTNLGGVANGLNAFVPDMKARGTGAIVVTGSKQGITNPPGNPAYNASKAAVKALTEQVSWEMRDTKVAVHLLVPGWTWTGLAGNATGDKPKPSGAWSPEQVVEFLVAKMIQGSFYVICPDGEVTEDMDKKRMMWSVGDIVYGRQPLSRWRPEYEDESKKWMEENSF